MKTEVKKRTDITGAVLAGGKSSRMGRDKALLKLDRRTSIERVVRTLEEVFESVVIISDRGTRYGFLGVPVYPDIFKHCGPLGGIHAALAVAKTNAIFVASCDLALLSSNVVVLIIDKPVRGDVVVASKESGIQPLCGVYSRGCLQPLEEHLRGGQLSVFGFLHGVSTSTIDVSENGLALTNINTPDEYTRAIGLLRGRE
ncbi:MAG: molybdenum cofactor guanylyltransferase [Bacteroidota bacterium]